MPSVKPVMRAQLCCPYFLLNSRGLKERKARVCSPIHLRCPIAPQPNLRIEKSPSRQNILSMFLLMDAPKSQRWTSVTRQARGLSSLSSLSAKCDIYDFDVFSISTSPSQAILYLERLHQIHEQSDSQLISLQPRHLTQAQQYLSSMFRLYSGLVRNFASQKKPVRVAVTGAAGNIGYALLFRIANGDVLGYDQPIDLNLIEIPQMQNALKGVKMELGDCAFPLLRSITTTDNLNEGFKDVECAFFVGSKPRGKGQERADLLKQNAAIFAVQGEALAKNASKNVKSLVVGNPANTNALILSTHAKGIPRENFCAMTRLDHDRALWQVSQKTNTPVDQIKNLVIWGNHSPTMFPDLSWTSVNGKPAKEVLDKQWIANTFIPNVKLRGQHIIDARGVSSAASAANAAINHMRSWFQGHNGWISFGVDSTGNKYGVPEGIFYSFPVEVKNGQWKIVEGLQLNAEQKEAMKKTADELVEERNAIKDMLK